MIVQNEKELNTLRDSGRRLARILDSVKKIVCPGLATLELDALAEKLILEIGGEPVFKGYTAYGSHGAYPASLCVSVNDEIVHGIPRKDRILKEGDIVGLDIGICYPKKNGLITDMATTIAVGKISSKVQRLLTTTKESLYLGIQKARVGNHIGDIGHAIQGHLEKDKLSVIRELVGHGVGKKLHEDPYVPNYGKRGHGEVLTEGMVLALEPMATLGCPDIILDTDGWTYKTKDGSLAAHFEHSIVILKNKAEVLTKF